MDANLMNVDADEIGGGSHIFGIKSLEMTLFSMASTPYLPSMGMTSSPYLPTAIPANYLTSHVNNRGNLSGSYSLHAANTNHSDVIIRASNEHQTISDHTEAFREVSGVKRKGVHWGNYHCHGKVFDTISRLEALKGKKPKVKFYTSICI